MTMIIEATLTDEYWLHDSYQRSAMHSGRAAVSICIISLD